MPWQDVPEEREGFLADRKAWEWTSGIDVMRFEEDFPHDREGDIWAVA